MSQNVAQQTATVDEDDISLNSTESEAYGSDKEFTVDRILAERGSAKNKLYLISWEGYPEEESTWEPKANVGSDTLEEWNQRLEREKNGLDEPFDIARFDALIARLKAEKEDRHRRRVAKRRRIDKAKLEALAERRRRHAIKNASDSSSEAIEENEVENAPGMKTKGAARRRQTATKQSFKRPIKALDFSAVDDNLSDAEVEKKATKGTSSMTGRRTTKEKPKPNQRQSDSSSEDIPLAKRKDLAQAWSSSANVSAVQQRKPAEGLAKSTRPSLLAGKSTNENVPPRVRSSTRGGKGATRGGSSMAHKNVFESREPAKPRGNLIRNAMDSSKDPKLFSNRRLGWLAQKQGRNMAERAPDIDAIGGLFEAGQSIERVNPATLRKSTREQADSEEPSSELFVPAHSPVSQLPEALPPPKYQYSQPKSGREVCFFWHKNQVNKFNPVCSNTYDCSRLHYYEPGAEISAPPPGFVEAGYSGPQVCFFWHRHEEDNSRPPCVNGDDCSRLHSYEEGATISPAPPGFVYPKDELPPPSEADAQDGSPMAIDDDEDFSHNDKPDTPPPWQELVAAEKPSDKPDVPPPWQEPVSIAGERRPYRSTCFFWDQAQKSSINTACRNGENCTYVHGYEPGVPIAPPPNGWTDMSAGFSSNWSAASSARPQADCWRPTDPTRDLPNEAPLPMSNPNLHNLPVQSQPSLETSTSSIASVVSQPLANSFSPGIGSSSNPRTPGPRARPPWDPHDPTNAICHFWYERGKCTKGNSCAYYHGSNERLPVAPSLYEQSKIRKETTCRDWENGYCSKEDCWFIHKPRPLKRVATPDLPHRGMSMSIAKDEAMPFTDEPEAIPSTNGNFRDRYFRDLPPTDLLDSLIQTSHKNASGSGSFTSDTASPRQGRSEAESPSSHHSAPPKRRAWTPRDANNAICYFYHQGNCKKGSDCNYIHSKDPTLPISPHPFDETARSTCPLWAEGRCPKSAAECQYLHENTQFVPSRISRKDLHDTYQGESPAVQRAQIPTGPRVKTVRFATDEPSMTASKTSSRTDSMQLRDISTFDGHGDSKTVCKFWRRGYCMRGRSCWHLHEEPSRQAQAYGEIDHEMSDAPIEISTGSNHDPLPFNRMARVERSKSNEVAPNIDADIDMLRSEDTQLDVGQQSAPASGLTSQPVPEIKRKITLDDYKRQKALANFGARAKDIVFGSDGTQSAFFDFGDIEQSDQDPWKQEFASTPKIFLDQFCMAEDFRAQQELFQKSGLKHGCLEAADPANPAMVKFVGHVVDELVLRAGGLLSTFETFAILVYPGKREEWNFLEPPSNRESGLRYFIFKHDFKPGTQHLPAKLEFGEPYRTLLAAKIHGLRLKNLLPPFSEGENPYKFFLIFPSSEKQMVEFFAAWILACHAESQVFDSLSEGSWDYFVKTNTMKGSDKGVIFVHESMAASLHQLPYLKIIIKTGGILFWNVSDSTSLYPLFPSIYSGPQSIVGRLRFTRLFPHGCAFLLTPSFLIAEPELSYTILNWFLISPKSKFATAVPGTWKLVCCHNFTNYLFDLANSKVKEKEDFEREHKDSPAKDSMLHQKKLSFSHCETRYKLHKALVNWQLKNSVDLDSDSESDHNDDTEHPLVQAPKWIDSDDEEGLINWFAGWSMMKLDTYRKFVVVGTNSRNATLATRIKEVAVPKGNAVTSGVITEATTAVSSPASLQKQKALEIVARLNAAGATLTASTKEVSSRAVESDVSMDMVESSPTSQGFTTHGIDARQSQDVLTLIAQTGCGTEDAHRLLAKANNDLPGAIQLHSEEEFDSQFAALVASENPRGRQLPHLAVGESDRQRAQEFLERPITPALSDRRQSGQLSPLADGVSSPQVNTEGRHQSSSTGSSPSRAGIVTENGKRFVPHSVRPNNAIRPEQIVKPGFVPEEDKVFYKNRRVVDGVPQYEVGGGGEGSRDASRRASLVMSPSEMSLRSYDGENGAGVGERSFKRGRFESVQLEPRVQPQPQAQPDTETETDTETDTEMDMDIEMEIVSTRKTFQATSSWYRELTAAGKGWQHIVVCTQWDDKDYAGSTAGVNFTKKYLGM
ncbi:hypothetical protein DL95DRAFT_65371 [Leptodontidium sp. 2 PMI_412]|nr:hypothetical protein DL95DRAFT_65371 [Leptodontidium sp. 2 PMI_412]